MVRLIKSDKEIHLFMIIENEIKLMKGSKAIFETLKSLGVDTVFGYPGGVVLDIYNEFYNQSDIKHILVRHEQSAVHAAEGYARVSGKCGVVLVTSGPGATNTVSGIVNAYLDGSPLLILTGQVSKNLIGKDAFQEANICDITKSCTKKVFQITSASQIQPVLCEAMQTAMSGKKGPVVVDLVRDIFSQDVEYRPISLLEEDCSSPVSEFSSNIQNLISRLADSKRPVIVVGGGVKHSHAEGELYKFVQSFNIPVVDTMMGQGGYPQDDEKYFGMIGIFGDACANKLLVESDLIISLGARFNDRISCMFKDVDFSDKFFQIDINPDEISKNINASDSIVGDISEVLAVLNKEITHLNPRMTWLNEAETYRKINREPSKISNMLHSFEVVRKINEFTEDKNVIFTSEVGQHQLWAVKNIIFNKERQILVSGGSGTMGFGFPAAIGAGIANPESSIVCVSGDGSFQMSLQELAVCVDYDIDIKIMILNNGYLGMVRQLQEKICDGRYSETRISNPDFLQLAKSYGVGAVRVQSINEIDNALALAFSTKGPFIVDFVVEPMEVL